MTHIPAGARDIQIVERKKSADILGVYDACSCSPIECLALFLIVPLIFFSINDLNKGIISITLASRGSVAVRLFVSPASFSFPAKSRYCSCSLTHV